MIDMLITTATVTIVCALAMTFRRPRRLLVQGMRTGNALRKDRRIPVGWRWALLVAFVIPIPGEWDELAGCVILAIMWPRYGTVIRQAWADAAR
jgi:hypothetical protein